MAKHIGRRIEEQVRAALHRSSAVSIAGARQVGKTTLAEKIGKDLDARLFDLSRPADLDLMEEPDEVLAPRGNSLTVIDEVQYKPDLYRILRPVIDERRRKNLDNGQFLLLGSAGSDNLGQKHETLTGRLAHVRMQGFDCLEITEDQMHRLWYRGSFPASFLADSDRVSKDWRFNYIDSYFTDRSRPLGMRTLLKLIANSQGSLANKKKWSHTLAVSEGTVARFLHNLEELFLIRSLPAYHINFKKRLVRKPKYYIRDSGLEHVLMNAALPDANELDTIRSSDNSWPGIGASWEGFVIENLCGLLEPHWVPHFYRDHNGAEIDLVIEFDFGNIWAIEIKFNSSEGLTRGNLRALRDLKPQEIFIVHCQAGEGMLHGPIPSVSLKTMMTMLQEKISRY